MIFSRLFTFIKAHLFQVKMHYFFKNSQVNNSPEQLFFQAISTHSKGYSRTKKVSVDCDAKFHLSNLSIDKDWLLQNAQDPSDEFLWSIQNAIKDSMGAVIYEHSDLIKSWTNNDIDRLLDQLKSERTMQLRWGDNQVNEAGDLLEEAEEIDETED